MTNEEKMTPEEAIAEISFLKVAVNEVMEQALEMAIKALSQEPCTDAVSREEEIKKLKEQPAKVYIDKTDYQQGYIDGVNQMVKELKAERQPCDDAISREMALEKMADYVASGYADSAEDFEEYSKIICQLPSVTPTCEEREKGECPYYAG